MTKRSSKAPASRRRSDEAASRLQRERDARVTRILDGALAIAVDEGVGAVTTTRLASKLGYTVGAFYRYFPSIAALLAALHEHTARLFYGAFFRQLDEVRPRLAELGRRRSPRVRALAEVAVLPALYRRLADTYPRHFALVALVVTRPHDWGDESLERRLDELVLPRVAEIVRVVHRGAESGALEGGDAIVRTMTLWIGVHAALAIGPLAERHPGLVDRDALVLAMTRTLLRGWGARDADLDASLELASQSVGAA
jgi:AcrR family transcriptional regulator